MQKGEAMELFHAVLHWLAVHTGTVNEPGPYYGFWSGFGSDLSMFAASIAALRHLNCGAPRCWRLGRFPTADRMHRLCVHHHPDLQGKKRTLEEIHGAHKDALQDRNFT
jgi:hypothetical protein